MVPDNIYFLPIAFCLLPLPVALCLLPIDSERVRKAPKEGSKNGSLKGKKNFL